MSTSDLYHTFRIPGIQYISTLFFGQKTVIHGSISQKQRKCPDCKSRKVIKFGQIERTFKMLPVGNCKVDLVVKIGRIQCKDCGAIKQPRLSFADPKKHYTRALERYAIDLCRLMTIQNVAALTGLSWDTVKDIHKRHLRKKCKAFKLNQVRCIAIDEKYLGKKTKFVTIVLDLDTGRVLHVGQSKGKDALLPFWKRLKRSKAKIEAVATDMASGYMAAVLEHLPGADLVLAHFHLVKWFNEKLTLLRRQLYTQASIDDKAVLKGSRWLLLKSPENLKEHKDVTRDEKIRLEKALEINKPLATAYYMKEKFRLLFQNPNEKMAQAELESWIQQGAVSEIKILKDAAKKLKIWKPFILNWYKHPISTAKLEATNRKIGTLQRNACGYRDKEYLKLRILNIHTATYALTG